MADSVEFTMALYVGLLADEERMLKAREREVMNVLFRHHVTSRPIWESRADATGRFVQLYLLGAPAPVLELPSRQIASLSPHELRSRLEEKLRHS